jgi:VWFA-related protein
MEHHLRNSVFGTALCFLALASPTLIFGAQAKAQQPDVPTLNVSSRIVLLDVVVTDKQGRPVTDLKQSDFAVYEDKLPQKISSFEVPSVHELPVVSSTTELINPDDPKSFGQSPVTVLVLDELNTHFEDSSFAVRSVRQYLESRPALLAQPTMLLIVADNRFHMIQNFTQDREALLKALREQSVHYAWKLRRR